MLESNLLVCKKGNNPNFLCFSSHGKGGYYHICGSERYYYLLPPAMRLYASRITGAQLNIALALG